MDRRSPMLRAGAAVALALALGACRSSSRTPTYHDDVAPVLARRCVRCHSSVAPPPLTDYEEARRVATELSLATRRRQMPPFGLDSTGLCGAWLDDPALTPDEVATLATWSAAGAPPGPPGPTSPAPAAPALAASVILDPGPVTPHLGGAAVRCFLVDPARAGRLVDPARAGRLVDPGRAGLLVGMRSEPPVRQASLYVLDGDEGARAATARDAEDPEPGWACPGATEVPGARLLASWSSSTPVLELPDGAAVDLGAGGPLILQVRYDLIAAGLTAPLHARVGLDLSASGAAPRLAQLLPVGAAGFVLPPGQRRVEVGAAVTVSRPALLWGVLPRMRTLGRTWKLTRGEECLAYAGHWSVYEEQLFRYRKPVRLEAGDRLQLACSFDTQSRDEEVREGERGDDEACQAVLYLDGG
jgi:hypothetical protein